MNPIKITDGEWWFKGCFIQKQFHPRLAPYYIFKDTEIQETIGTCCTFQECKRMCALNEVKNFKLGYTNFI